MWYISKFSNQWFIIIIPNKWSNVGGMPHFQAQPTVCVNIRVISFSSAKDVFFHIWRRHRIWTQKLCTLYQNLKHSKAKGQDHSTIQPAPGGLELSTVQPTCSAHALVAQHPNRFICCLNDCCKNYFNPRLGVSQDPPKSVSLSPKRATKIDERLGPLFGHTSLCRNTCLLYCTLGVTSKLIPKPVVFLIQMMSLTWVIAGQSLSTWNLNNPMLSVMVKSC